MSLKIVHKLGLLVLALIAGSVVTMLLIFDSNREIAARTDRTDKLFGTEQKVSGLMNDYAAMAAIGYRLLTEGYEKKQLETYGQRLQDAAETVSAADAAWQGDEELASYAAWFRQLSDGYRELYETYFAAPFLPSDLNAPDIRTKLGRLTTNAQRVETELRDLLDRRIADNSAGFRRSAADSARLGAWVTGAVLALSLLGTALFGRSASRGAAGVLRRIREMQEGRWAEAEARVTRRRDEFGDIERYLAEMGERLREHARISAEAGGAIASLSGLIGERAEANLASSLSVNRLAGQTRARLDDQHLATATVSAVTEQAAAGADELRAQAEAIRGQASASHALAAAGSADAGALAGALEAAGAKLASLRRTLDASSGSFAEARQAMLGIRGIARQTGILALNAAIEASRQDAGGGRGFSVIASEVRALAGRTEEFSRQVQAVMDEVESGLSALSDGVSRFVGAMTEAAGSARGADRSFAGVAAQSERVYGGVEQLHAAAGQIAAGMSEIVGAVERWSASSEAAREEAALMASHAAGQEALSAELRSAVAGLLQACGELERITRSR